MTILAQALKLFDVIYSPLAVCATRCGEAQHVKVGRQMVHVSRAVARLHMGRLSRRLGVVREEGKAEW